MLFHLSRAGRGIVFALALAGAIEGARATVSVPRGLTAEYFTTTDRTGQPAFSTVDTEISTAQIGRWWRTPPESFSVRWTGYLIVPTSGFYRLATTSDDGSWLSM